MRYSGVINMGWIVGGIIAFIVVRHVLGSDSSSGINKHGNSNSGGKKKYNLPKAE